MLFIHGGKLYKSNSNHLNWNLLLISIHGGSDSDELFCISKIFVHIDISILKK